MKMHPKEKLFAELLDKQYRKWEYCPKKFKIRYRTYTPDFYLPEENLYVEIVGSRQAYSFNKRKGTYDLFKATYPEINFVILDYKGNPYPNKTKPKEYKKYGLPITPLPKETL